MDDAVLGGHQAHGLRAALEAAGVDLDELWMQYFRIGGSVGVIEVEAYLHRVLSLPALQRDLLAQACNELTGARPRSAPYSFASPGSGSRAAGGGEGGATGAGDGAPVEHEDPGGPGG